MQAGKTSRRWSPIGWFGDSEISVEKIGPTTRAACCRFQRRLDNGSLAKVKLDNTGSVQVLYENDLQKNTKLAFSGHFDATNLEAAPKIGVAVDVKN